jgi:two-component system, cell cycle sensor histidine kinase and response regulator CckA
VSRVNGVLDILDAIRRLPREDRCRLAEQLAQDLASEVPQRSSRDQVWFLESLDRVNRCMQSTGELEGMMSSVLEATLELFDCDRAWLVSPCNPSADAWRVVMEHTRREFPGAFAQGMLRPTDAEAAAVFRLALSAGGAVLFGPGCEHLVPDSAAAHFHVRSQMVMPLFPKGAEPYLFGLHHCSEPRPWGAQEKRLFEEIGHRLTAALTGVLMFRSLRESERRLDDAQRIAHVGHWDRDLDSGQMTLSDEACRIFGFSPEERILDVSQWHQRWLSLLDPEDRVRTAEAASAALGGGPRYDIEYRVVQPGGQVRIIHSRGEVIWDDAGRPKRMFGMMQDITELRQAELALRVSEARFRTIVEHAADAFLLLDERLRVVDVNRQACDSLGYSRDELLGMHVHGFDVSLDAAAIDGLAARVRAGETVTFETRHRRKDGSVFPVEIRCAQFEQGGTRFLGLVRDITARKQAERALIESHSLLHAVVEGTSDPIFIKDLQGSYLMINSAGAESLGRTVAEMIGKQDQQLFGPEMAASMTARDQEVIATQQPQTFQETRGAAELVRHYLTTKGVYRDEEGQVIGLFGISRDLTALKRLENQLRQAQKLEAVGRLAGGIAHDFNNLLTVINGCTDLALLDLGDTPSGQLLLEIHEAGKRATTLTRQLLAFSRQQVLDARVIDLNQALTQVGSLLKRVIGEDVELSFTLAPSLGLVKVDPAQFEQAVVNLAVNARDALPEGGWLKVETRNVELDGAFAASHPDVRAGRYAQVAVSDSGHGMDPTTVARIFEPFFTTKPVGKGTGLGLAMVYGFLKQSGGHIEVESGLGHGTTFRLYLPLVSDLSVDVPRRSEPPEHTGGAETILLVEDDDAVRRICRRVLLGSGYQVLEACNGQEALEQVARFAGKLDLLVTDLVMPRIGGRQLAAKLRDRLPRLRVLFLSGYTEDLPLANELTPTDGFLQKPFTPSALANKVRALLDSESSAYDGVPRRPESEAR